MKECCDAILISAGPSSKIDGKRVEDAVQYVVTNRGSIENYSGIWIPSDGEGSKQYEGSQRQGITNHLIKLGANKENILELEGKDTTQQVKGIIDLTKERSLKKVGIPTYILHFLRYEQNLQRARRDRYPGAQEIDFKLIWSSTTPISRWPADILYGILALTKEQYRLKRYSFKDAASGKGPLGGLTKKIREIRSEKD